MFGGLSFLAPAFLLGALAVAVPIVLHLFRRRTEDVVDFPAMRLLRSYERASAALAAAPDDAARQAEVAALVGQMDAAGAPAGTLPQ